MARGRMVSQSVALDPQFNELSPDAQLLFFRTVPFLDRDGLILGNPVALWARVAPLMDHLHPLATDIIEEWVDVGLVVRYQDRGRDVLWFKGFRKNQIGMRYDREPESEFDPPPGYNRGDNDFLFVGGDDDDGSDGSSQSADFRQTSGNAPENGRQTDGKPKNSDSTRVESSGRLPADFRQNAAPIEVNRRERRSGNLPAADDRHNATRAQNDLETGKTRGQVAAEKAKSKMPHMYSGIEPKLLTQLTNEVKRIRGMASLIEKPGNDRIEDEMCKLAYDLYQQGFTTTDQLQWLHRQWDDYAQKFKDRTPYPKQLYDFALRVKNQSQQPVTSGTVDIDYEGIFR